LTARADLLPDDDFEDGLITDQNQRLRQRDGEWMQSRTASAGENDRAAHGARLFCLLSFSSVCGMPLRLRGLASRQRKGQVRQIALQWGS
jgi:hypothetical protein